MTHFRHKTTLVLLLAAMISGQPPSLDVLGQSNAGIGGTPNQSAVGIEGPYFSSRDRLSERIMAAINHTKRTLDVAIFDLTHAEITATLEAAHRRGVRIRIVADEQQAGEPNSEIPYLIRKGVPVRVSRGYRGDRSVMHHKFAVFDGKRIATGSFNWTRSADGFNYENLIFLNGLATVLSYQNEFERLWRQAKPPAR